MARTITIPNNWTPRDYQLEFLRAMDSGTKRAFLVWCRRSGKDSTSVNFMAKEAVSRVASYFYLLPTQRQARRVVWLGIDKQGRRIIDQAFPPEIRKRVIDDEMLIELKNGSIVQCLGSENYNSLVGTNVAGIVFSEWALSNPRAYDYLRPILVENNGWAIFNTTPRGKNHAYELMNLVKDNPKWFFSLKTAADTKHISLADIDEERKAGMPESRIQQEFFCSFDAENIGSVFEKWIVALESEGKIGAAPYDPRYPVETVHDIGHRDAHAIWFIQSIGREKIAIDYHEDRGHDLRSIIKVVHAKPYVYSRHIFPHDMNKFEFGAGSTISEQARQLGLHHVVAPKLAEAEQIESTRVLLPRMRFDAVKCRRGLQALRSFRYEEEGEEDGDRIQLKPTTKHDWSSHGSKALMYYAVTPEEWGQLPLWARGQKPDEGWKTPPSDWLKGQLGLKTGDATQEYDPLASYRGP